MLKMSFLAVLAVALASAIALAEPPDHVVINEIYVDSYGYYDGAEYIELYNPTAEPVDISGWILTGTEYDQICNGTEDQWAFPSEPATIIPAGGYVVVTKDGGDGDDGFLDEFTGSFPDLLFECYDATVHYTGGDTDNGIAHNMLLMSPDTSYSDEIGLVGGTGYGIMCGSTSQADVVRLYTDVSLTTVVDLIEYMDPEYCTEDPCSGDDGSDANAWQGQVFLGNSLGRDEVGTDNDDSFSDFSLQGPTPFAANVASPPPWIRDVRYSPIPPVNMQVTQISATITDDGTVASAEVYYRPQGAPEWAVQAMTAAMGDSVYTGDVPAQPPGILYVDYYVRAVDDQGSGLNYPALGDKSPYTFALGYTDIYSVQFVPDPAVSDTSQLVGQAVNVQGVVTAAPGTFSDSYFYVQADSGAYKGVKVYASGLDLPIEVGDLITACGNVDEYNYETEIDVHFPEAVLVHTERAPVKYTSRPTTKLGPDDPNTEKFEGQLIRTSNADVTALPDEFYDWKIQTIGKTGEAKVGDASYYVYEPEVGDVMSDLSGILTYYYRYSTEEGWYKIQPRSDDDIQGPPRITNVVYAAIPPAPAVAETIKADFTDNVAVVSPTLYYAVHPETTNFTSVAMTAGTGNTYKKEIGGFADGQRVNYYVWCTDGEDMTARRPSEGYYRFYVGTVDIYDVQFVPDPAANDASPYEGEPRNIAGYVSREPGIYSDYYFYLQSETGEWNGIKIYERTGTISLNRGDHVTVCGKVQENYSETELSMHFATAYALNGAPDPAPEPVSLANTNVLQGASTGEKYEGVLVLAANATVEDPDLGHGEWAISNAGPGDTCRVDDDAEYTYQPFLNDVVDVTGPVSFTYGNYKIEPAGDDDITVISVDVPQEEYGSKFGLYQNMPNPFNPKTTIAFSLPEESQVSLEIFNVAGRKIRTLVNERLESGPHEILWDGRTDRGKRVASGVYFYRLGAGEMDAARKMVLLK